MQKFNFYIPLKKEAQGSDVLTGVASTISIDKDGERMSTKALEDMKNTIITSSVNLFGNHQHDWENTLGVVNHADLIDNRLHVRIQLDDPNVNPKVKQMLTKLARGIKLGLSVGGAVTDEKNEYDRELGKKVKIINGVKLYEISLVGIPSNSDSFVSIPSMISKCYTDKMCPLCFGKFWAGECEMCLYSGIPEYLNNNKD